MGGTPSKIAKVKKISYTERKLNMKPSLKCKLKAYKLGRVKALLGLELSLLSLNTEDPKKDTNRALMEKLRGEPLAVGTLEEIIDDNHAIVSSGIGLDYYTNILSFVDRTLLEPGCTVLLNNKDHSVVGVLEGDSDPLVQLMKLDKAPSETYADVGGLDRQIQEIKECVEQPLKNPELFSEMGIKPPRGCILYGPPGTGKTLLVKAVANMTSATFLRIVGSELIQKYLGDGPKLVRELFKVAAEHAPSIIFIDEIDAIGHKREGDSWASKEVQRTMLELLNQLDGFDTCEDVKVIMATNKIESLDPALIRPGRIDRKIQFDMPNLEQKRHILKIHSAKMTMGEDVVLDELVSVRDDFSGADLKALCSEAGMIALRERRKYVSMTDFKIAKDKLVSKLSNKLPVGVYS